MCEGHAKVLPSEPERFLITRHPRSARHCEAMCAATASELEGRPIQRVTEQWAFSEYRTGSSLIADSKQMVDPLRSECVWVENGLQRPEHQ